MTRFATDKSVRIFSDFPGMPQVCVSHDAMMYIEHRKQGHGHAEHVKGIEKMKELSYDYALCFVRTDNVAQIKILEKANWKQIQSFIWTHGCDTYHLYGRAIY